MKYYERKYPLDVLAQIEVETIESSFNEYEEILDPTSSVCDSRLVIMDDPFLYAAQLVYESGLLRDIREADHARTLRELERKGYNVVYEEFC